MEPSKPHGEPQPVGQYSNVTIVDSTSSVAYVAGHVPIDEDGQVVAPDDFPKQANLVFDNLAATLESVGSSLAHIAHLRAFLVDEGDTADFRDARQRAFAAADVETPPPATTIVVKSLYGGSRIELDAVAVVSAPA